MKNLIWTALLALYLLDIYRRKYTEKQETKSVEPPQITSPQAPIDTEIEKDTDAETERFAKEEKDDKREEKRNDDDSFEEKILIKVQYCTNSLTKQYEAFKNSLVGNYTNIEIEGEEFPLPNINKWLSKIAFVLQMVIMVLVIGGQSVRGYFSFIPERILQYMEDYKWMIAIANFFIFNQISTMLNSSGAFEVFFKGSKIWSKLDTKAVPMASDMIAILANKGYELIMK